MEKKPTDKALEEQAEVIRNLVKQAGLSVEEFEISEWSPENGNGKKDIKEVDLTSVVEQSENGSFFLKVKKMLIKK